MEGGGPIGLPDFAGGPQRRFGYVHCTSFFFFFFVEFIFNRSPGF